MSIVLHHLPDVLLVVVSCWLGLSLFARAPRDQGTRVFAWFCLNMALYGLGTLLPQLTASPQVAQSLNRLQLVATVLTPAVFLHFIVVLTSSGYITNTRRLLISIFYSTGLALALYAVFGALPPPEQPLPPWSRWGEPRFPAGILAGAWFLQRLLPMLTALVLMALAYRRPPRDAYDARLRFIFAVISLVGVTGGLAATIVRDTSMSPALPRTLMALAMLALAYAVLVHRALLPNRVARRTFFYSLIGSLLATGYVALVLVLEWLVGNWLQIDVPLVAAFSLVVLFAIVDPLRDWLRRRLDRHFYRREFNYVNLARSLSDDLHERGNLADQVQAALTAICRALGVRSGLAVLATPEGLTVQATYGQIEPLPRLDDIEVPDELHWLVEDWSPWPPADLLLPLRQGDDRLGLLVLGKQYVPQPFSESEYALLDYLTSYLSMAISHAHARDLQEDVIMTLAEQSRALREQQAHLARQAQRAEREEAARQDHASADDGGLRVAALGPLRVERNRKLITRWGGSKAGTYQAEALFAFLFDRLGKGVTKDEAAEVIWPDLDIERADSAFHRTLAALRRTLEPGLQRGNQSQTILYHHERYWLEPGCVAWSDTEAFIAVADAGTTWLHQGDSAQALRDLERASQLYRGDYMDDCPFFGDSAHVEEQRAYLRTRAVDVHLALGAAYEAQGRIGEAISAYRRALMLSPTGCPAASAGLTRLQVAA